MRTGLKREDLAFHFENVEIEVLLRCPKVLGRGDQGVRCIYGFGVLRTLMHTSDDTRFGKRKHP